MTSRKQLKILEFNDIPGNGRRRSHSAGYMHRAAYGLRMQEIKTVAIILRNSRVINGETHTETDSGHDSWDACMNHRVPVRKITASPAIKAAVRRRMTESVHFFSVSEGLPARTPAAMAPGKEPRRAPPEGETRVATPPRPPGYTGAPSAPAARK